MEKLTYSIAEAASVLGISKSYAYQMVKEQKLPVLSIGSRKVVPIRQLERWLEENTVCNGKSS